MELKGTTAVIAGSSRRLGSTITKAPAKTGCDCIRHYYNRNERAAEEPVEQIHRQKIFAAAYLFFAVIGAINPSDIIA